MGLTWGFAESTGGRETAEVSFLYELFVAIVRLLVRYSRPSIAAAACRLTYRVR